MAVLLCILSLNDDLTMLYCVASTFDGYVCVLFCETLKCTHLQIRTFKNKYLFATCGRMRGSFIKHTTPQTG